MIQLNKPCINSETLLSHLNLLLSKFVHAVTFLIMEPNSKKGTSVALSLSLVKNNLHHHNLKRRTGSKESTACLRIWCRQSYPCQCPWWGQWCLWYYCWIIYQCNQHKKLKLWRVPTIKQDTPLTIALCFKMLSFSKNTTSNSSSKQSASIATINQIQHAGNADYSYADPSHDELAPTEDFHQGQE